MLILSLHWVIPSPRLVVDTCSRIGVSPWFVLFWNLMTGATVNELHVPPYEAYSDMPRSPVDQAKCLGRADRQPVRAVLHRVPCVCKLVAIDGCNALLTLNSEPQVVPL